MASSPVFSLRSILEGARHLQPDEIAHDTIDNGGRRSSGAFIVNLPELRDGVLWLCRRLVTGALPDHQTAYDNGACFCLKPPLRRHGFTMSGVKPLLPAGFERHMGGDQYAVLEDLDRIRNDMDIENAPT